MKKLRNILLIDDDSICSWLNKTLLDDLQVAQHVECVSDGESAINYLHSACCAAGAETQSCPDLIFLDLNMPGMDGFEVLEKLTSMHSCNGISLDRVVVLTTSLHHHDMARAKSYNILSYLAKPLTEAKVMQVLQAYPQYESKEHEQEKDAKPLRQSGTPIAADRPAGSAQLINSGMNKSNV